jgi:multicomponent Na+:H+ antiporter subunit F
MTWLWLLFFSFAAAGIALCLVRAAVGPTTSDRVVGVDGTITISIALMVLLASFFDRRIYLDVASVYAVLGFIGVLVVARYMERGV